MIIANYAEPQIQKQQVLSAMSGRYEAFYSRYTPLKPAGGELRGPCPLHGGGGPNFSVNPSTGLWHCFTGCQGGGGVFEFLSRKEGLDFPEALAAVAEWLGTPNASLPAQRQPASSKRKPLGPIVQTYDYTDEAGTLLFQVVRYGATGFPKDFRQRRPDGQGGWIWKLGDTRLVLYRLPQVLSAVKLGFPVYFCEGEKDADALAALGLTATTAPMGAGKWEAEYTEVLRGANVVILPDNDDAGRAHTQIVAAALYGQAKCIRIVCLSGLPEKGDVSDWLNAGGTPDGLRALAKQQADYQPSQDAVHPPPASLPAFSLPAEDPWPQADPLMFYGLAGDIVRMIDPHTESDPVALLVQILAAFGSAIGRSAHFTAEADQHFGNLFAVLVGVSAKARKGTSWGHIKRLLAHADPQWESACVQTGLSSGEGLIWHVRDAQEKMVKNKATGEMEPEMVDPGTPDKRLLVMENEFASVLRVAGRDGSTLSSILRDAWDRGRLQTMTKNNAAQATGTHISVIGHITTDELKRELTSTESSNGFANRFLWLCVRRSKQLPEGGSLDERELSPLVDRLASAIETAKSAGLMKRDGEARAVWLEVYAALSEGGPGLAGAVTSRSEAQTMRLALLYALLDEAPCIRREHLTAALALWEYVEASARFVFGDSLGDPVADEILRALRNAPDGMSRNDLRDMFQRHQSSGRIGQALALLLRHSQARAVMQADTGGRPAERWFAGAVQGEKTQQESAR